MRRALPLLLAIAAFFLAAVIWLGNSRAAEHAFDSGSSANTSPDGLSLALAYLRGRAGRPVKMLTTPVRPTAVAANGVVFRTLLLDVAADDEPAQDEEPDAKKSRVVTPPPLLSAAEEEWVRGGGRFVLSTNAPMSGMDLHFRRGAAATKVFPIWPGLESITLPTQRSVIASTLPPHLHAVFTVGDDVVIARRAIGRGELFVLITPELLTNQHLGNDGHLQLLDALAGTDRPVYFDEVVHGMVDGEGAVALLTEWRLGPMLALLAIAAMLAFWRNARRIGPPADDYRDTRSDAVDLVASLGALYGRSMSNAEALTLYHEALTRTVAAQLGLRGDALHRRVAELTGGAQPPRAAEKLKPAAFERHLTIINDAFRTLERVARGGLDANHR